MERVGQSAARKHDTRASEQEREVAMADNPDEKQQRPLLANIAVKIDIPSHLTDEEAMSAINKKLLLAKWTDAHYTSGSQGTILDTPAGIDL